VTPAPSWRPPPASANDASLLETDGALRETFDREPAPPAYRPAPRTLGRYMLLDLIGEGGMGQVYRAYDPELDRMIAIKRLRVDDHDAPVRLQREAQAIARLSHPNVVAVHDVGRDEASGDLFIAMELVDGQTLQTWLFSRARSWREIARVFAQAGRGLAAAHRSGVLHRDFKPHNVLVTSRGRAKVVDFGLAKPMGPSSDAATPQDTRRTPTDPAPEGAVPREVTPFGARMGTPAYMPPEAILGQDADPRGDQFSFAVALYEAFAGRLPFSGKNAAEYSVAVLDGRLEPWPRGVAVPRRLQRAILRALARRPADRHPDLAPLIAELEREPLRRRTIAAIGGALALGGALATFGGVFGRDEAEARCRAVSDRVPAWWTAGPRERMHAAMAALSPPFGAETAERSVLGIDELARQWADARFDACMSADATEPEPADARSVCLEREAARMQQLAVALTDATPDTLEHAVPAVEAARRELERCREPAGLQRFQRLRQADAPGTARAALEAARHHLSLGATAEGLDALASLDPERLDGAIAFEAELLRARLHHGAGDLEAAEQAYVRATHVGLGRADPVAAGEWHECWGDLLHALGRLDQMDEAYARAEQLLHAELGARSAEAIVASATRGHHAYATGDYARALERYAETASTMRSVVGETDPRRLLVDGWVAQTEGHLGRLGSARETSEDLVRRLDVAYGPSHPHTLGAIFDLGVLELRAGDAEAALGHFEHVLHTRRALGDEDPIDLAACEANIGGALLELHREPEGIASLERALATLERAGLPATHAQILAARANLGIALRTSDRVDEAEPVLTAVLADMQRSNLGATANALAVRLHLARIHLDGGESREALDGLEDAVDVATRSGDRVMAGRLRIELARALDGVGRRSEAGRVLAQARADLGDPGAGTYLRALETYERARGE
jgi:tetratricopeptide (TPR) repeat protein/predicted Ser/Thr protein kinase